MAVSKPEGQYTLLSCNISGIILYCARTGDRTPEKRDVVVVPHCQTRHQFNQKKLTEQDST